MKKIFFGDDIEIEINGFNFNIYIKGIFKKTYIAKNKDEKYLGIANIMAGFNPINANPITKEY